MFNLCAAMEFKHLPAPGGLYDQNPVLLERFMHIFGEQAKQREKEEAERERKRGGPKPRNGKMSSRSAY